MNNLLSLMYQSIPGAFWLLLAFTCSCGAGQQLSSSEPEPSQQHVNSPEQTSEAAQTTSEAAQTTSDVSDPSAEPVAATTEPTQAKRKQLEGWYCYRVRMVGGNPKTYLSFCHRTKELCEEDHRSKIDPTKHKFTPCSFQQTAYCIEMRNLQSLAEGFSCGDTMKQCELHTKFARDFPERFEIIAECTATD